MECVGRGKRVTVYSYYLGNMETRSCEKFGSVCYTSLADLTGHKISEGIRLFISSTVVAEVLCCYDTQRSLVEYRADLDEIIYPIVIKLGAK